MNPKQEFVMFVHFKALLRDLEMQVREARQITSCAEKIPDSQIPPNPLIAAEVYVRHMDGDRRPFEWMYVKPVKNKITKGGK